MMRPMMRWSWLVWLALVGFGCDTGPRAPTSPPRAAASGRAVISVIGTNDVHGHLRSLPILAGYVSVVRELRERDGGGVVLLDAGDMFQGTLESNLTEGEPIVAGYAALGYDAVTIGNHEFDYGPVGPAATVQEPGDDPRGALFARVRQASYPFLTANLADAESGERVEWDRVTPSVLFERAGVRVGVIGVTTEATLRTTNRANVADLAMIPLARAINAEARDLRERGAMIVLVTAHAGGRCTDHDDPRDTSSCETTQEIHQVTAALDDGAVDAIVAGHTHQAMSHFVHGVPVIESYSYGRAFGRIDLTVDRATGRVVETQVHAPHDLCERGSADQQSCRLGRYEDQQVSVDDAVRRLLRPAIDAAAEERDRALGVEITTEITRSRSEESALGNLITDLMRRARPDADVALTNGGGLRADLPAGSLTYGSLYEAFPFDNLFATIRLTGADLARIVAGNLGRQGSFFSLSGVRARARCVDGRIDIELTRENGRRIADGERLVLITTDFLATGGDGAFGRIARRDGAVEIESSGPVRDHLARALSERGGTIDPRALFDSARPRVRYPGRRPVRCD